MTIDELIERSHAMAVEKGWWDGGERSVVEQVNNFHAEISEAWEEYRCGRMQLWWSSPNGADVSNGTWPNTAFVSNDAKPEGFWIEIADLCIRLADTMGAYGWKAESLKLAPSQSLPLLIHGLHTFVCDLTYADVPDWHMSAEVQANVIIAVCLSAAAVNNIDLLALCELKMAYNATRSIRHGGKRA
jgi:hypothetical protein